MGKQKQKPEHGYVQMSLFEFLGYGFEEDPQPPKPKPEKVAQTEFVDKRTEWERFLSDNYMKGGMNVPDEDPLVAVCTMRVRYDDASTKLQAKAVARTIAKTATYHFANMDAERYALTVKSHGGLDLVLISPAHIVMFSDVCDDDEMAELLDGKKRILIGSMNIKVFDKDGNLINRYRDGDDPEDIRQEACIADWRMDRFSENRINEGKPVHQFYEVSFSLPDLIAEHGGKETGAC